MTFDDTSAEQRGAASLQSSALQVSNLLKVLLTLVDKNTINYADVDDIFGRCTIDAADPACIPMYTPPAVGAYPWAIVRRRLPEIRDYAEFTCLKAQSGSAQSTFKKTYGEGLHHWTLVRLFFFMFHAHLLICVACLLLNMTGISFETVMWTLSAVEATMVLLKTASQVNPPDWEGLQGGVAKPLHTGGGSIQPLPPPPPHKRAHLMGPPKSYRD